jgi:hypothetical protein
MAVQSLLAQLVLASVALAKPLYHNLHTRSQQIKWGSCDFPTAGSLPVECGTLSVPLDYTNPTSNETLTLALIKSAATQTPSKGSILFNFGGPGYEAIQTLNVLADALHL